MTEFLLDLFLFSLVIAFPCFLAYGMCWTVIRCEKKSWRKKFDSIQIGDRFIKKLEEPDPFRRQYAEVVEVKNKAMTPNGGMYLKYNTLSTSIMVSERSSSIQDFFDVYNYVPYNNQDKQS
jgi:hypothetical protein